METITPRKLANRIKKEKSEIEAQKSQKPVKELTIAIEWTKSKMWGNNPKAEVKVMYQDGSFERRNGYKAGGYGYDKESTVIAAIFNDFLRYKLYQKHVGKYRINQEDTNHPYGVYYYDGNVGEQYESGYISKPTFNGGVGTSCYYNISKFIDGEFDHIANGKTFDVYKYTEKI